MQTITPKELSKLLLNVSLTLVSGKKED